MALFNNKAEKEKVIEQATQRSNHIGKGTTLTGDIVSEGMIRIDGTIKGNITSISKVVLGEGSNVIGNIKAENAEIQGHIQGKINIEKMLTLKPKASIEGDILSQKLVIDSGARFNGNCVMNSTSQANGVKHEKKKAKVLV